MNLIEIKNDLFDVAARLKSVDPTYELYFNVEKQRYEVYERNHGFALAFVVPYQELDARTVKFARFTRVENSKHLFVEIEKNNQKIESDLQKQALNGLYGEEK